MQNETRILCYRLLMPERPMSDCQEIPDE